MSTIEQSGTTTDQSPSADKALEQLASLDAPTIDQEIDDTALNTEHTDNDVDDEEATPSRPARKRDWYRHPATIVGSAALAAGLVWGGIAIKDAGAQANYDEAVNNDNPDTSQIEDTPETGGILNTLTVEEINQIYDHNYGSWGDNPPFNKAQFDIVIRNLSHEDAEYVLSSLQGGAGILDVSRLLNANGLPFDDSYPLN